jgi:hypothetical protein
MLNPWTSTENATTPKIATTAASRKGRLAGSERAKVYQVGGSSYMDFVRIGLPLNLLT